MRLTPLGAAAVLMLLLGGCGDLYGGHGGDAYRSNAGFTRENPPPVGAPVSAQRTGAGQRSDPGGNVVRSAPTGEP